MAHAGMNYLAITIAAAVSYCFGALYYSALSGPWLKAIGRSEAELKARSGLTPYVLAFASLVAMAVVLAGVLGHLGPGQVTLRNGIISALFVWAGFVATTIAVNYAFSGATLVHGVIDAGHWLGVLLIQGAIIGGMGLAATL